MTIVLAHRGASRDERENTVAAFRRAAALGAPWVELDVRRASDGALVVHHDPVYPDGRVVALTPGGQRPPSVPLLADALGACEPMRVNVEIKNGDDEAGFDPSAAVAGAVAAEIAVLGWHERVLVSCFHRPTLDAVRVADAQLPTALLTARLPDGTAARARWLAGIAADGHEAVHPWWPLVDGAFVAAAHGAGLAVNVWTCDEPDAIARLVRWGVDGVCSNVPDVALAAVAAAASWHGSTRIGTTGATESVVNPSQNEGGTTRSSASGT